MGWRNKLNEKVTPKAKQFIEDECALKKQALSGETLWLWYKVVTKDDDWSLNKDDFITLRASMTRDLTRKYGIFAQTQ